MYDEAKLSNKFTSFSLSEATATAAVGTGDEANADWVSVSHRDIIIINCKFQAYNPY